MKFSELNLMESLLKAIDEVGYESPTPIQEQAIPPVLEGKDLLGCAQTGTGKTAAFGLPILQHIAAAKEPGKPKIKALILTPTRELALQIEECLEDYGKYSGVKSTVIFGGVSQKPQEVALRKGVDILVATPGRLNDLIGQKLISLSNVEIFVLDEADRMLDMGFIHDVRQVVRLLPPQRQNLMFSATMPKEIEQLANTILHAPVKVEVTPQSTTVEKIDQSLYFVDRVNKPKLLIDLIREKHMFSVLVFTRTKHGADKVVRMLTKAKIKAQAIHGNKSQNARQAALNSFKNGEITVLVATDIAARGIDVEKLEYVVNYDLSEVPETYVHRIGRTGRAGESGIAIAFCDIDDMDNLKGIQKLIGFKIPVIEEHPYPMEVYEKRPKGQHMRQPRPTLQREKERVYKPAERRIGASAEKRKPHVHRKPAQK